MPASRMWRIVPSLIVAILLLSGAIVLTACRQQATQPTTQQQPAATAEQKQPTQETTHKEPPKVYPGACKGTADRGTDYEPEDCPASCATDNTVDVDAIIANPTDPANDPDVCLKCTLSGCGRIAFKSADFVRIKNVFFQAKDGKRKRGNPFVSDPTAEPPARTVASPPMNPNFPSPPEGKCFKFKAEIEVQDQQRHPKNCVDPHIYTGK